ncbi:MAG: universal stress protein [Planctomycetota bacterium]
MIRLMSKRVLVPTDFSPQAEQALLEALDIVEDPADVTALHVAPPLESYAVADPAIVWESVSDETRRQRLTESFRSKSDPGGHVDPRRKDVDFQVLFGYPVEEIAKFAADHHYDLILMPSHGRTGLSRLFVGSVAERVVRSAHCPVLVLRD